VTGTKTKDKTEQQENAIKASHKLRREMEKNSQLGNDHKHLRWPEFRAKKKKKEKGLFLEPDKKIV